MIEYRPITPADIDACVEIFYAADEELAGMRMDGPPIIYCATEDRIDHSRYLPGSFALP